MFFLVYEADFSYVGTAGFIAKKKDNLKVQGTVLEFKKNKY